ncbi:MAG: DUF4142 domain-containing protein [Pirellulales bacterium]
MSAALAAATMLTATLALAQERPLEKAPRRVTANRPVEGAASADQTIAQCLAISNQEEVALGTLAAGKTKNPKVKQFAEMIAKDHGQFAAQLEKFGATPIDLAAVRGAPIGARAGAEARTAAPDPADRTRPAREGAPRDAPVAEQRTAGHLDFIDIKRQLAQRCLENARTCWNEKPAAEADMAFVGSQLVLHQQMVDAQEVLRQYASPELQGVIDQSVERSRAHLVQAKQLIDELSGTAKPAAAARSES